VLVVEADERLRELLCNSLPVELAPRSFGSLEQADGATIAPGRPAVLVLGPSQASAPCLERVGAALEATPGTGAVLVVDGASVDLMRLALRAGVHDALSLSSATEHLPAVIADILPRLEDQLESASGEPARPVTRSGTRKGFVTTVFSPKGGVGKSVVAVNLAAGLAQRTGEPVVIVDLDLQFGDVAVMLRLQPRHTFSDAVSAELLDEELLRSFLGRHEKSGVLVLAAPTSPSEADLVEPAAMLGVLELLQSMFSHVVIDTPPQLSELVLQSVTHSGAVVFVVGLDVPAVKSARLGLQAFDLLQVRREELVLVLNRAGSQVHLTARDIEKALGVSLDIGLPSELAVPQSVNEGQPALLAYPRSRFAAQVLALADLVLSKAERPSGKPRR
jgi:pilus assembly protein CpaE